MTGGDDEPKATGTKAWADMTEDDMPPGFDDEVDGANDVVGKLSGVKMSAAKDDDDVDEPDPSLKMPGLREPEGEVEVLGADSIYKAALRFEDLGLSPELLKGLYQEMGFEAPSKIQAKTLPMILSKPYSHMIAQAHNGSGKTTCFVLAMLSRVDASLKHPQAICVVNARELAVQTSRVVAKMAKYTGITVCTAVPESRTVPRASRRGKIVDQVVVGTHGTLKNFMGGGSRAILQYDDMRILVFDEADHMLAKDGAGDDSLRMLAQIRGKCPDVQVLLFSATFEDRIKQFAMRVAPGAKQVLVERDRLTLDAIKQFKVHCGSEDVKVQFLKDAFSLAQKLCQTVVFVRKKVSANKLASALKEEGYSVTNLTGEMDPDLRDQVVEEFRAGKTKILIATDVLARGFDLETISLVINYDVPVNKDATRVMFENYLHRIGRSGRFGRKGCAFNLYTTDREARWLRDIEDHFSHKIDDVSYDNEDALEAILKEAGI